MDSQSLSCFVKVVSCGSIAEAARILDMAPTTVAQRIKTLESSLGCRLLQRSGRTVKPTAAGIQILSHVNVILKEVEAIRSAASNTDLPAGPLKLGATPTVIAGVLPDVLTAWVKNFPSIDIFIEPAVTRVLYDKLLTQDLDLAILAHPNFEFAKDCAWQKLREEELVLLTPAGLEKSSVVDILASQPFIRYDRHTVAGRMVDDYLRSRRLSLKTRFELDGIYPIMELVSRGLGVAIIPNSPVIDRIIPAVQRRYLPAPCPKRTIGVLWLRSSPRVRLIQAFVTIAVGQLLE